MSQALASPAPALELAPRDEGPFVAYLRYEARAYRQRTSAAAHLIAERIEELAAEARWLRADTAAEYIARAEIMSRD